MLSREALIQSLSVFILAFLFNARNKSTRIASYLRRLITKHWIKIHMKFDSANESVLPQAQLKLGVPRSPAPMRCESFRSEISRLRFAALEMTVRRCSPFPTPHSLIKISHDRKVMGDFFIPLLFSSFPLPTPVRFGRNHFRKS